MANVETRAFREAFAVRIKHRAHVGAGKVAQWLESTCHTIMKTKKYKDPVSTRSQA